jgi:uncharacterized protein YndB with AHSA1/START domain
MTATTDESVLELSRVFDAPPARVFEAWLNREEWQSWIGTEGIRCDVPLLEPRVGGRYRVNMNMSDGRVIAVAGVFKLIEAPRRLAFTWGLDGDANRQSLVTITFNDLGDRTELILMQEGLGTVENRDGHSQGWNSALNKLDRHLANRSAAER